MRKVQVIRCAAALFTIVVASFLAGGCSNFAYKLAYQSADRLVMNRLDSFFDPTPEQKEFLETRIRGHLAWHRAHELPRYANSLSIVKTRGMEGVTPAKTDWFFAETDDAWRRTLARILPDFSAFLATLSDAQIDRAYARMQKDNVELEDYLKLSPEKRAAEREKKMISFIEDWCGSLTDEQRAKVHTLAPSVPDTTASRLAYRKVRQAEFAALLHSHPGAPAIEANMRRWLLSGEAGYTPAYRADVVAWRGAMKKFVIEIDRTLTAEQHQRIAARIDNLVAATVSLHKEVASSAGACLSGC